ncbi:sigma factor-like helix-turn-helix DNA-binding protein [Streptomyces sp. NPDC058385]|uniref:sigma factor-like helix-turn-helix DNA-binding protein n=1 Tax=Streptomyces sp. NPDC058385 TaxID=3346473 RepID=UPI003669C348
MRHCLNPLLGRRMERERRIIEMGFGREMARSRIGDVLDVSRLQVSRSPSRTLDILRSGMLADD